MWRLRCALLIVYMIAYSRGNDTWSPLIDNKKCCEPNFALSVNPSKNTLVPRCVPVSNSSENVIIPSSKLLKERNVGFPNCSSGVLVNVDPSSAHCVDYVTAFNNDMSIDNETSNNNETSINSELIGLSCQDQVAPTTKITLKKCCPDGYKYSMFLRSCHLSNATEDSSGGNLLDLLATSSPRFNNIARGMPNCSEVTLDFIFEDRKISNVAVEEFTSDQVCVDRILESDLIGGRRCVGTKETCGNIPCVRKCCPPGEHMNSTKCSASFGRGLNLTFHDVTNATWSKLAVQPTDVGILHGVVCANGKHPLMHNLVPEDINYLTTGGNIHYRNFTLSSDDYCIEDVQFPKKKMDGVFTFVCFKKPKKESTYVSFILISVGLITSCVFLLATFVVYASLPALQNIHGMTLMCHVASFLLAFVSLVIVQMGGSLLLFRKKNDTLCRAVGFSTLFGFLSAFAWMNIMCFDIWWTFGGVRSVNHSTRKQSERKRFAWYSLYAWGLAIFITATAITFDLVDNLVPDAIRPKMGSDKCWFPAKGNTYSELLFFATPITIFISCNVVLFVLTARNCSKVKAEINRMQKSTDERKKKKFQADMNKLMMNGKLFVVMGVNWAIELLGLFFPTMSPAWVYVPDAFNALIGVFVFAIFVLKAKVLNALADRFGISRRRNEAPKNDATGSKPNYRDPRKSSMSSSIMTTVTSVNDRASPARF